jgi:flagellar basal-body rod protein FlgG
MADGLQIAASGLLAQQWRLDAIANDLANVNTPGYRSTRIAFTDIVDDKGLGGVAAGAAGRSARPGAFADSDNPLAIGLEGPGFLQVSVAGGGTALTRAGDLRVDGQRQLVLSGGERVSPPITVPDGVPLGTVTIATDGTVSAGGKAVGKLTLVEVDVPDGLEARGGGLFATTSASGAAQPATETRVRQGVLEQANVDLASSLVEMMDAQRVFDLASRAVRTQDQLLEIANGIRR